MIDVHPFRYDQGVMSSLLTLSSFEDKFPQVVIDDAHPNHATLQSFVVAVYELGCFCGALVNLKLGDKIGRRKTIIIGGSIMIVGAILQTASISYAMLVVARIITGIGNVCMLLFMCFRYLLTRRPPYNKGLNTSTVPSYHAECSAPEHRGAFIMIEGTLIAFGIMLSYWIDIAFYCESQPDLTAECIHSEFASFEPEFCVMACADLLPDSSG